MVNNAGISGPNKPTHEITESEWNALMAVNVNGAFFCTKHAIPVMMNAGGGSITNLSSVHGITDAPDFPADSASKDAVGSAWLTDKSFSDRLPRPALEVRANSSKSSEEDCK